MKMIVSTDYIKHFDNAELKIYNATVMKDYDVDFFTTFNYKVGIDCIFWFNI